MENTKRLEYTEEEKVGQGVVTASEQERGEWKQKQKKEIGIQTVMLIESQLIDREMGE